jgi:uncharacterized phage protein gp47/JayE
MFESMTYEKIMADMLDEVTSAVDKREGSIIWDALAPAALELSRLYAALDKVLQEGFADTASREYLKLRAGERGLEPYPATYALALAEINADVALGTRFFCEKYNWVVTGKAADRTGLYYVRCEELGSTPNAYIGRLVPLDYIEGLTTSEILEIVEPGEDEESTEAFRARYVSSLTAQSFGGNAADYIEKALGIAGVGGVKVYPAWNGGGTVKVTVCNEKFTAPGESLISRVQDLFDPLDKQGAGVGLAPIGHVVTVAGVEERRISVSFKLSLLADREVEDLRTALADCVDEYFTELARGWSGVEQVIVRISQLESRILALNGVLDVSELKLDGLSENLILDADEIPVRGELNVE